MPSVFDDAHPCSFSPSGFASLIACVLYRFNYKYPITDAPRAWVKRVGAIWKQSSGLFLIAMYVEKRIRKAKWLTQGEETQSTPFIQEESWDELWVSG